MEVRSRRVGGANYQVPREVRPERRMALALRWIINGARNQKGVPMHKALAQELKLAAKEEGNAVKKKEDTQDGRGKQSVCPLRLVRNDQM